MCRHKNTGVPRCATDTSLARKHRRIASKITRGLEQREETVTLDLNNLGHGSQAAEGKPTIDNLKGLIHEAQSASLYDPDYDLYITQVGHMIANMVDSLMVNKYGQSPHDYIEQLTDEHNENTILLYDQSQALAADIVHLKEGIVGLTGDKLAEQQAELATAESNFQNIRAQALRLYTKREESSARYSDRLAQVYLDVLSLTREMGGRVTNATDLSNAGAVRTLNKSLKYIPSNWVDLSNLGDKMTVKAHVRRAHYRPEFHVTKVRVPARIEETKPTGWEPSAEESLIEGWERVTSRGNENTWSRLEFEEFEVSKGSFDDYGNPMGNRWRQYEKEDGSISWRRSVLKEVEKASEGSELFVSPGAEGESVAIHEYVHRVEYLNSRLVAAEKAHHARRTKLHNGDTQQAELYHQYGSRELVQPNHYADRYMGRVYAEDSEFTEIASNGVQALFYGEHGGFMGIGGRHDPDPLSRAFTLGALAVC